MALNTGDNIAITFTALRRAAILLVRQGITLLKPISDRGGIYAYLMGESGLSVFYLVARNTPPTILGTKYMHVVSTQRALLTIAREEKRPILMAIFNLDPHDPVWMLYHPEEVLEKNLGDNRRSGIVMVNFEYYLGAHLQSPKNVAPQWDKLKDKWEESRGVVQTKFGRAQ